MPSTPAETITVGEYGEALRLKMKNIHKSASNILTVAIC